MSGERSPEFDEWVEKARRADILEVARECGAVLKRAGGAEWTGHCPAGCTKNGDGFGVNTKKGIFICRPGGAQGGVVDMVMHAQNLEFVPALEFITKEPPPRSDRDAPARPIDSTMAKERREEQRDRRLAIKSAAEIEFEKNCASAATLWSYGEPIPGTIAWKYLERRGLRPASHMLDNLRYIEALPYKGYADKNAKELTDLGEFPALIAAIRGADWSLIGVHRIYIDPQTHGKLSPPGDRARNAAKKAFGNVLGGCVWLGPVSPFVAIAEGIETALAYWQLGGSGDCTVASAVSLGNLAGGAKESLPHPLIPKRTFGNEVPDPDKPGVRLPANVTEVLVLGDGDSEKVMTRHAVARAVARFEAEGRKAYAVFAPDGQDFNDVLLATFEEGDAAA